MSAKAFYTEGYASFKKGVSLLKEINSRGTIYVFLALNLV